MAMCKTCKSCRHFSDNGYNICRGTTNDSSARRCLHLTPIIEVSVDEIKNHCRYCNCGKRLTEREKEMYHYRCENCELKEMEIHHYKCEQQKQEARVPELEELSIKGRDDSLSAMPYMFAASQQLKADAGKFEIDRLDLQMFFDIDEVRKYGEIKYGKEGSKNWFKVPAIKYVRAIVRHLFAMLTHGLRSRDAESGIEHYKHVACNAMFLCKLLKKENYKEEEAA